MKIPQLSVVVIGRNEGQRLSRCLASIDSILGDHDREVIYVDSASTDGSPQVASDLGAQVIVLNQGRHTAAAGRNAGWQRALAPYILFLDGDTVLRPNFPQAALDILEADQSIGAVWGHRREMWPERSIYNRVLDLDWIYAPGETLFCGGDVLMRRSVLAEVEGYDSELMAGEEPELCRRLRAAGHRILHVDIPMTGHDLGMTRFVQYWRRALRAGYAYAEVANRFRRTSDPMWLQESQRNFRIGGFWLVWLVAGILLFALSPWWLLPWLGAPAIFAVRSASRARWKAPGRILLLLLYGIHSHLQQIPILFGQLTYLRVRRSGGQGKRIQYKEQVSL
jgi:glycosyltransferase involved in cell wall biosynthesis